MSNLRCLENICFDALCQSNFQASDAHSSRVTWKSWTFSYEMALKNVELKILRKEKFAHTYLLVDISHLQTLTVLSRKQNSISQSITISVTVCSGIFSSSKIGGVASIHGCKSFSNWNCNYSPKSLCVLFLWEGSSYPTPWLRLISALQWPRGSGAFWDQQGDLWSAPVWRSEQLMASA